LLLPGLLVARIARLAVEPRVARLAHVAGIPGLAGFPGVARLPRFPGIPWLPLERVVPGAAPVEAGGGSLGGRGASGVLPAVGPEGGPLVAAGLLGAIGRRVLGAG
jgi:hypothetical protein